MSDVLLRFLHISDTHLNPDVNYINGMSSYTPMLGMNALTRHIQSLPFTPDFILHTGDVAYDPYPEIYPTIKAALDQLPAPVYVIAGNHDHMHALQQIVMGRDEAAIQPHLHYEFEANGVQFLCVDSNAPAELPAGCVPDEQLAWLDEKCSADDERPLVIAVHHNPVQVGVPWLDDWMRITNGDDFHAIVQKARHRLRVVLYGHIHQNMSVLMDGVLYVSAASSWVQFISYPTPDNTTPAVDADTQPSYNLVTLTQNRTYVRRYAFGLGG